MDIAFKLGQGLFNYRVGCIPVYEDMVLLHKGIHDDFWTIVGGRVKVNESTEVALRREVREELQQEIITEKFLSFVENFFTYNFQEFHELLTIYLVKFKDNEITNRSEFQVIDGENILIFKWFNIKEILNLTVKPDFLKDMIINIPSEMQHIVNIDS